MKTFFQKLRLIFDSEYYTKISLADFSHVHKNLVIIAADPKTDMMFAAHRDKQVIVKIKSLSGKNAHVVRGIVSHSLFKASIDGFIGSIADALHLPVPKGSDFYKFIDGAMFNIAKSLRDDRKAKRGERDDETPRVPGIPSPFIGADGGIIKS